MKLIDTLERRFGQYAIPGLIRIVAALNLVAYALCKFQPRFYSFLELDPYLVRHGEYWRLVTYIFIPKTGGILQLALGPQLGDPIVTALAIIGLWIIGDGLEQAWGAFRLNLFYLLGMLGTTVAAMVFDGSFSNLMLNSSLFFAFAWFYPDAEFYIMMILPVRAKWLAWISGALLLLGFLGGDGSYRAALVASLANYLIFFGPEIFQNAQQRAKVQQRRREYADKSIPEAEPLNQCSVCRKSDLTHPDLDFRVGKDGRDYCAEHLPKPSAS